MFVHAAALYGTVALAFRAWRFGRVMRVLDRLYAPAPRPAGAAATGRIVWAVTTVGALVPLSNGCLVEAVTGHCLLRRAGVETAIRFGLDSAVKSSPVFHARLVAGDRVLLGEAAPGDWRPLAGPPPSPL